jgi:hypothetical protein
MGEGDSESRESRGPHSLFQCPTVRRLQLQHTTAFGSYLEWLTANRWLGHEWRMDGFGSQSSASLFLAKDPKVGV